MLLQTNSYIVPKDKRAQHARLVQRFRATLSRLGCDHFEAYEQVGANWSPADTTGRFVQLMRFRDRKHQLAVQGAERNDPTAQGLIKEFCELINFPYQQQQGLFAVGFYHSLLPSLTPRGVQVDAAEAGADIVPENELTEPALTEPLRPSSPVPEMAASSHPAMAEISNSDLRPESTNEHALSMASNENHLQPAHELEPLQADDADVDALISEMESEPEASSPEASSLEASSPESLSDEVGELDLSELDPSADHEHQRLDAGEQRHTSG
jgi:hypothetical protein